MKFHNGMWLEKQGYQIQSPREVYDYNKSADQVTFYGPYKAVRQRGDTLNTGILTVTISSPQKNVLSIKMVNHAGAKNPGPYFQINRGSSTLRVEQKSECCDISSGELCASVNLTGEWGIRFTYRGRTLTASEYRSAAHIVDNQGKSYIREQLSLDAGEMIYGLGERFTPFVKNGQSVDIWNADGGTNSEQAYKNIPFYISSKGYGIFVNEPGRVSYEIGSEILTKTQFSVPGQSMEYFIIGGDTLKEVIGNYTLLTGRPPLVPEWTFGLWLTTSFTTNYNEETVMSFIDGMLEREIPLTTFHFDCFWMKGFEWCNFLWDEETFPDPKAMLSRIKEKGIKICVWINPYIAQKSRLFDEGREHGYFVQTGDGGVWQWDLWQAGMALVDFTNPEAVRWYQGYLEELIDMGVDCFKTDFGERIPVQDSFYGGQAGQSGICYWDGSDPDRMHNYYTQLYNQAVYQVLETKLGKGEACLFARSATAGGQQYPVHWGGDNLSNYPSMAQSLRGGLSLSLCGFGYWSHDIGGFEAGCSPDIFKRWTQFGLLSSHSRYHGNSEYKVPWIYDEEAVAITREYTRLKMQLMPYIYRWAVEAAETGLPIMRPLFLEYPEDRTAAYLDQQYMLGESILVAPIFSEDGEVEYYLPKGDWTNLLTGEIRHGAAWYKQTFDYHTMPLFVREHTILPLGAVNSRPDYPYNEGTTFAIYQLSEGVLAQTKLYANNSGNSKLLGSVSAIQNEGCVKVNLEGCLRDSKVLLAGISSVQSVHDGDAAQTEQGVIITTSSNKLEIVL